MKGKPPFLSGGHLSPGHVNMAEERERTKNRNGQGFQTFATRVSCWAGSKWSFLGNVHHHCVDRPWTLFQLLGHPATGREHCNDHRDFSNGISDTELAEPGRPRHSY